MAEQHSAGQPRSQSGYLLIALLGIAFGLHIWGIQQDLPFTPEVDEPVFVSAAVGIAASGDLNPHWFGHPGSTVIYPLAAVYRVWEAVTYHKNLAQPDPGLRTRYKADPGEYYLLGRLLAIGYSIASLVFVYLAGAQAFGERAGLVGAGLMGLGFNIKMLEAFLPLPAFYALYVLGSPERLWRNLAVAMALLAAISLAWITAVDQTPASQRPYVGSSRDNSELNLAFGYNGVQRLAGMGGVGTSPGTRWRLLVYHAKPPVGTLGHLARV
jgi:hypothetical protein